MRLRTKLLLALTFLLALGLGANYLLIVHGVRKHLLEESRTKAEVIGDLLWLTGSFVVRVEEKVEELIGGQMVVEATLAAHLVDVAENEAGLSPPEIRARLKDVAERTVLDEFWITGPEGHAYLRNVDEIDFTFPSEPGTRAQAHEFWPLLSRERGQVIQSRMPREYDGRTFKYAGVSGLDQPRIVQVGYEASSLDELTAGMTLEDMGKTLQGVGGLRAVQIISPGGEVIRDFPDTSDPDRRVSIETARFMPEVRAALSQGDYASRLEGDDLMLVRPVEMDGQRAAFLVWFDASATNAEVRRLTGHLALVAAVLLVIGVGLAFEIAGGIASPLARLAEEAEEIGKGNLERSIDVEASGEVAVLSRALQNMVASLKTYIEDLRQTTAAKQRLESELSIAAEVQKAMLPKRIPEWKGLDIGALTEPARIVGGDFYDVLEFPDGRIAFAVGDVSGKGLSAALLASQTMSVGRALAFETLDLRAMLDRTNGVILRTAEAEGMFVTAVCGTFDPGAGVLSLFNAGHLPPVLCREGERPRRLEIESSLPLGMIEDFRGAECGLSAEGGDLFVFYTDGVTEALNTEGELFGFDRLAECLEACNGMRPEQVVEHVRECVRQWAGPREASDDLTVMALRVV